MTGYNHTLAGAIIAVTVPLPLMPLVAFVSHFVLDAFPHFGNHPGFALRTTRFKHLLLLDGSLCIGGVILAISLFPEYWWMIGIGTFLAALPDFMWLLWRGKVEWLNGFFRFAGWIQWGERPWAYPLEVGYALIFTAILLLLA